MFYLLEDACHATRSNIEHFTDMVGYMKSWTRSYTNAKKLEATMLRNIKEGLTTMKKRHAEKSMRLILFIFVNNAFYSLSSFP